MDKLVYCFCSKFKKRSLQSWIFFYVGPRPSSSFHLFMVRVRVFKPACKGCSMPLTHWGNTCWMCWLELDFNVYIFCSAIFLFLQVSSSFRPTIWDLLRATASYSYEELVATAIWTLCCRPWWGISYRLDWIHIVNWMVNQLGWAWVEAHL